MSAARYLTPGIRHDFHAPVLGHAFVHERIFEFIGSHDAMEVLMREFVRDYQLIDIQITDDVIVPKIAPGAAREKCRVFHTDGAQSTSGWQHDGGSPVRVGHDTQRHGIKRRGNCFCPSRCLVCTTFWLKNMNLNRTAGR